MYIDKNTNKKQKNEIAEKRKGQLNYRKEIVNKNSVQIKIKCLTKKIPKKLLQRELRIRGSLVFS